MSDTSSKVSTFVAGCNGSIKATVTERNYTVRLSIKPQNLAILSSKIQLGAAIFSR
jgi:hypothetical protein